jgi:hypothetical protein
MLEENSWLELSLIDLNVYNKKIKNLLAKYLKFAKNSKLYLKKVELRM